MNTYIVFRPEGLKQKFAYCIAPCDEKYYRSSAVEIVTDTVVEPYPCDDGRVWFLRDGEVHDREAAIRRARESIADTRAHDPQERVRRELDGAFGPGTYDRILGFRTTEAPTT
jgi:hypothetical protein